MEKLPFNGQVPYWAFILCWIWTVWVKLGSNLSCTYIMINVTANIFAAKFTWWMNKVMIDDFDLQLKSSLRSACLPLTIMMIMPQLWSANALHTVPALRSCCTLSSYLQRWLATILVSYHSSETSGQVNLFGVSVCVSPVMNFHPIPGALLPCSLCYIGQIRYSP